MLRGELGADRALALLYVPAENRPALTALFRLSVAMGSVLRTTTEPMIARIRLAWWRERLEGLDQGEATPGEPRLEAARTLILPRGISGQDLAGLADGWERLLDPFPWSVETSEGIWLRGLLAFGLAARLLGQPDERLQQAGGLWAVVDAARHCSDAETRRLLVERARAIAKGLRRAKFDRRLRPLSMLAALAMRDLGRGEPFEPEGTPGRALTMLRHRLTGRL